MLVHEISYHPTFVREFKKLSIEDQKRAATTEERFLNNPLHPSLRLHPLKGRLTGYFSISVTQKLRIIFIRRENGEIVFLSIGMHDIYRSFE